MRCFGLACIALLVTIACSGCEGRGSGVTTIPPNAPDAIFVQRSERAASPFPPGSYPTDVWNDGVMAYYRLDDPLLGSMSALSTADAPAGFFNGTYGASVALGRPSLTSVQTDAAASFPGSGSAASVASVPANAIFASAVNALTVEAWIKPADLATTYYLPIVSYGRQVQGQAWVLQITEQSRLNFWFKTGGGNAKLPAAQHHLIGATRLAVGQTSYIAATYDGATARLYVNGVQDGTLSASGPLDYDGILPQWGLGIGGALGPNAYGASSSFNGTIDEVAVYRSALPAARIGVHYSDGRYAPKTGAATIYINDLTNNRIDTYNADGTPGSLTISSAIADPESVSVDTSGKIYVLNRNGPSGGVITTYNANGTPSSPTIDVPQPFTGPLAVDALGSIFVAGFDSTQFAGVIASYAASGIPAGVNFTVPYDAPAGIAVTPLANLYLTFNSYISDNAVMVYPVYQNAPAPTIDFPAASFLGGIAVDAAGKIFVALGTAGIIETFNADGTRAQPTITDGISFPESLAIDALGKLYVFNAGNHTITAYNSDGTRTTPTIEVPAGAGPSLAIH